MPKNTLCTHSTLDKLIIYDNQNLKIDSWINLSVCCFLFFQVKDRIFAHDKFSKKGKKTQLALILTEGRKIFELISCHIYEASKKLSRIGLKGI